MLLADLGSELKCGEITEMQNETSGTDLRRLIDHP